MNELEHLLNSLFVMASMVEARDLYTGGHLWRVSQFCRLLAEAGGLPPNQVARVALGGFLHDLGKIAVPDAILNKPDRLTEEEYAVIKTHPSVGRRLLADHPLADLAVAAVHGHHERADGKGYPQQLPLDQISLDARIVSICDAFDAMTSNRPYRLGMPTTRALAIVGENLNTQFDPVWGERFIALGAAGKLDRVVGYGEPGIPLSDCPRCNARVVTRRGQQGGDLIYCRPCGAELALRFVEGERRLFATGKRGTPAQLEPEVDMELVRELVRESARLLAR